MGRRRSDQDLDALALKQREHGRRLDDHDTVLVDIRQHLGEVVAEFTKLKTYALAIALATFGGSDTGRELVKHLLG